MPIQLIHQLLSWRADFAAFTALVAAGGWFFAYRVRQHNAALHLPRWLWLLAAGFTIVAGFLAEWVQHDRTQQLVTVFSGFGPTYAEELRRMGHARITLATAPDDPVYLELIEAEKSWLQANPLIADVYTFRHDDKGQIRLIVDSETDYDHNGRYEGEREQRTPIGEVYKEATDKFHRVLHGTSEFESEVTADRWGLWVSSFTPILNAEGNVEAAVGIDYPAAAWVQAIAGARLITLGTSLVVIAILLLSVASHTVIKAEVEVRRRAQSRLEVAREAALMTSAAKSEFLAVTGHQVRPPLTAIMSFADMLSDTSLDETQTRYVAAIATAGERLMELVNSLLDFTKIEDGEIVLAREPWSPSLLVREVIEMTSAQAARKGITLHFGDRLGSPLTLLGDASRVRQILLNLMANAVKYTELGSITVQAAWSAVSESGGGKLAVSVVDTGIGISPERLPQLFQMFAQSHDSSSRRPSATCGIGLAICKRLVEAMGGEIRVHSTVGVGTKFTFTIACPTVKAGASDAMPAERSLVKAMAPLAPAIRALVIDDDNLNRELLQLILRRQGCKVDLAANGEEGCALFAETRHDVIFLDLNMPGLDGFATAKNIRAHLASGRRVPIIAVTGLTDKGTRERCLEAGMDDYITRPVHLPALIATLDRLLVPTGGGGRVQARHELTVAT